MATASIGTTNNESGLVSQTYNKGKDSLKDNSLDDEVCLKKQTATLSKKINRNIRTCNSAKQQTKLFIQR